MPGATLPNTGLTLPSLSGDIGVWGEEVNAALSLIDAHDHTAGKGVKVPISGLNINADFPLAGNGLTTIGRLALSKVAALTTGAVTLFCNAADGELYWRNNSGTNVKLTSGGSINTSLVGGIVGDYAAVGAEVAYDDANKRYTFKYNGSPKPWAKMASADVRIYPTGTGTVYVGLKSGASLAASFDMTLPLALPASQVLCQIDASGVMTFTNTLANNANITLQGTGHILRGARTITCPPFTAQLSSVVAGGGVTTPSAGRLGVGVPASSTNILFTQPMDADLRLTTITSVIAYVAVSGGAVTFALHMSTSGGNSSAVPGATASTSLLSQYSPITLTPTTPIVCATDLLPGACFGLSVACVAGVTCNVQSMEFVTTVTT